jgi:integrase/recombinase XerC
MDHKESFLQYLRFEKRYSPHTIRSYGNDLNQFGAYLTDNFPDIDYSEISSHHVRGWIVYMMETGMDPASIHRKISCLRVFFRWLRREELVDNNPVDGIVLPKRKKVLPVFVAEEAMDNLLDNDYFSDDFTGLRNRTIIEMIYLTGIRRAELIGLKVGDIDFQDSTIRVTGKRNKQRIIPLTLPFVRSLREYLAIRNEISCKQNENHLFLTEKGNKLYDKSVYNIVRDYLNMVTTNEKKSPHILRHTFATHMLNRGADLNAIKEFLGHANLSATQIYTHNTFAKLRKIYRQAHPRA